MILYNPQPNVITRLLSPYGLALISSAVFLFAWLFPPKIYSYYIQEPDLLFFDLRSLLFFSVCVIFFLLGVGLVNRWFPNRSAIHKEARTRVLSPVLFILFPLITTIGFCVASCVLILKEYPLIIAALLTQNGSAIKNSELAMNIPFGRASTLLMGILWWAHWRYPQLEMGRTSQFIVKFFLFLGYLSILAIAILKLSRNDLILIFVGTIILLGILQDFNGGIRTRRLAVYSLAVGGGIIALFLLFSFIRGVSPNGFIRDVMGYTIASYNRLAAVVDYRLRYEYAGHGVYLFSFAAFNNKLNNLIPISEMLQWPSFYDWWQSEFSSVWNAGLNGNFIWAGTFGYIFADIGWFAPLMVFVYGTATGWAWRAIKKGKAYGLVMYPWFAFCVLFWFGTNNIVESKVVIFILLACILAVYERIFCIRPIPLQVV
jgi:hypothetical protein